ncbi:MAG: AMP-binding protein [Eubacteriales bacterium]|nr:AMP-binding protein [Eubacteriales bacterium]MDD4422459.1 AMP-binding protein [Eubacteriales bacterium]
MNKTIYEQFLTKQYKVRKAENIRELVLESARIYRKRTAFYLKEAKGSYIRITYERMKNDYLTLANTFISMGLKNKPIAVTGINSYEWAITYLAASTVGIVVPLDKEISIEDMTGFIEASEAEALIADEKYLLKLQKTVNRQGFIFIRTREESDNTDTESIASLISADSTQYGQGNTEAETMPIDRDESKILIFTSGTTGNAKGVCLSHRNICANIMSVSKMVKIKSKDKVLSILPLHHTYECTLGFLKIIYSGACITFCDGLRYIYRNIGEYHPSVIVTVPLLLEKVSQKLEDSVRENIPAKYKEKTKDMVFSELLRALPFYIQIVIKRKVKNSLGGRLHTFIVGAAGIDKEIVEQLSFLGVRVLQGYGLTECSPLLAGNNDFFVKSDSTGLPIHDVDIKIFEPNSEGVGEIIARGENIMRGYYRDPEATEAVIRDGWFHTGDLGYLDENGFLYITGRSKNVIITKNGKNIYPEEIESRLYGNKLVADAIIIGASGSEDVFVKAKILPNLEAIKEALQVAVPTKEEIHEIIRNAVEEINDKLPSYKRIKSFIIRDREFEKTTTQKIKRFGENISDEKQ